MESVISRKRKRSCHVIYDEKEDEEEKIDKFYSLIKSIREARDRLINMKGSSDHDHVFNKELINIPINKEPKQIQVWKPSFQREDFMEDDHDHADKFMIKTPLLMVPTSSSPTLEASAQKEEIREGLDLKLSL